MLESGCPPKYLINSIGATNAFNKIVNKMLISGQSNLAMAASNSWDNRDSSLIQCSLGPQESPSQAGPRSVQPIFHSKPHEAA